MLLFSQVNSEFSVFSTRQQSLENKNRAKTKWKVVKKLGHFSVWCRTQKDGKNQTQCFIIKHHNLIL